MINNEEFVETIKSVVINDSIKSIESTLLKPPGRSPQNKTLEMSNWFNSLDSQDKSIVKEVIKESIETSVFGFLCVLDGVRAIENNNEKGVLQLYYVKDDHRILLNDPNDIYLHDLL